MIFNVIAKAGKCLDKPVTFNIGPLGFIEKLKVEVHTRCECECDNPRGVHAYCNRQGTIDCGTCRYGKTFQKTSVAHLCLLFVGGNIVVGSTVLQIS